MAAGVHPGDGRTRAQRRADALIALGEGEQHLACRCPNCVAPAYDAPSPDMQSAGAHSAGTITPSDPAAQPHSLPADAITPPTGAPPYCPPLPATSSGPAASPHPTACTHPIASPRPTFHIVVSLETLLGADNAPAFLDGHGIIDATVARQLVAEAKRSYVHTKHSPSERHSPPVHSESSEGTVPSPSPGVYAPSGSIRALVTAGELCCTFPVAPSRCAAATSTTRSRMPPSATDVANLKPLCRLHHRVKTFVKGWRDYQDPLGRVFFTSPTGHTFLGNAFTGRDVFRELAPARRVVPNRAGARIIELRHDRATAHRRARARRRGRQSPALLEEASMTICLV